MKKILLVLLTFGMLCGCQGKKDDKIKIGVVLALTGDLSSYGQSIKQGIELAYENIDTSAIELVFTDSRGEANVAINSLHYLLNMHGINYIIGDVSSSTKLSMIPIIDKHKIFLLSPGAATPELTNISPLFARNYPSSTDESIRVAELIYDRMAIHDIATIYSNDDYGSGLSNVFKKTFTNKGGNICFDEGYEKGTTQFKDLLLKMKKCTFDCLYLSGNQREMGAFIKQYKEYGFTQPVVANMAFLENDCLEIAGEYADNVIVPVVKYDIDEESLFVQKYKERYNQTPTMVNALGYDALNILIQALNYSQSPSEVATYIRNLSGFDGAMGNLSFEQGNVVTPIEFKIVIEGEIVDYN